MAPGRASRCWPRTWCGTWPAWTCARRQARHFAARRGLLALRAAGSAAGLFVDDLDLWAEPGADQDAALSVVQAVCSSAGRPISLFVNRGFAFWPRLGGLDAVLLEELTPALADRLDAGDQLWVREQVVPAVRAARSSGAACFGLTYEAGPEGRRRATRPVS